jgi:hypothetical protein
LPSFSGRCGGIWPICLCNDLADAGCAAAGRAVEAGEVAIESEPAWSVQRARVFVVPSSRPSERRRDALARGKASDNCPQVGSRQS